MKANITSGGTQEAPISRLKHYPLNPRRGDVSAIAESLEHHGQYRPVVVQKSTNYILAGNHTVKAAKKLGWTKVQITYVDCDDATAKRIVLADNRLNDLADYDQFALKEILESLPDLEGTGFTTADIQAIDNLINDPFESEKDPSSRPDPSSDPKVKIGGWQFTILKIAYQAWDDQIKLECDNDREAIRNTIKTRLRIPEAKKQAKAPKVESNLPATVHEGIEPITAVKNHPLNARQGDVGSITQSLQEFGQYRPIVANKQTGHILVGNHTYISAVLNGWEEIAVCWIDVPVEQELKILLIDNRTSDLATYDKNDLTTMVLGANLTGTGYTLQDVEDIQNGTSMQNQPVGKITIKVGNHSMRLNKEQISEWSKGIDHWQTIVERLEMPIEACHQNKPAIQFTNDDQQF